ncbi:MAG: DUF4270 domain-containing protein [Prevotella sp.]|nr:DUF4270 domain-containing protein [Prevotella sp.]
MKSILTIVFVMLAVFAASSCDDNTDTLGSSLTGGMDHLEIATDTFTITTRSIAADSVLARNTTSFLGSVRDPETGEYISSHYMTQFHTLENYEFPSLDSLLSVGEDGGIIADSCELRIYWDSYYGDSLSSMKCTVYELEQPMREDVNYYSNYNPLAEGLIRSTADGGLRVNKSYTLEDMNVERSERDNTYYSKNIRVLLNDPYTDKDGNTYNNYGTYIMRKYYTEYGGDPDYFRNSVRLTNNVIPGFYIESSGGLGNMAEVSLTQLNLYFKYKDDNDSVYVGTTSFAGTQEVLQRTNYVNETGKIAELVADNTCTYLKTPAGIFTEVTLPVEEICLNHATDTINSAKFTLQRINNEVHSEYSLDPPQTLLIIPRDSLYSFFENKEIANYKTSFLASYNSTDNTYVFNNIGSMVKAMQTARENGEASEDWNKAVIIPVVTSYNVSSTLSSVVHDMSLTSTRLIGGPDNTAGDIKISVIYSKYK